MTEVNTEVSGIWVLGSEHSEGKTVLVVDEADKGPIVFPTEGFAREFAEKFKLESQPEFLKWGFLFKLADMGEPVWQFFYVVDWSMMGVASDPEQALFKVPTEHMKHVVHLIRTQAINNFGEREPLGEEEFAALKAMA